MTSKLCLFIAFGLLAMAAARPLDTMDDFNGLDGHSRELQTYTCGPSGCPTYDPGCNFFDLSTQCYFTPAMLKLPSMPVTGYYCGPGCPAGVTVVKSRGEFNIYTQQNCPQVTCAKTIGQVTAQNGGCASTAGYINALAKGQTKELFINAEMNWITTALKSFCADRSATQISAVAGMLAQGFASAQAKGGLTGTAHVCGCCDGTESATQQISAYWNATANAVVQTFVQAVSQVFGPGTGDCEDAPLLAQASTEAAGLAQDMVSISNEFHKELSLSRRGDRDFFNRVCTYASVPWTKWLEDKYANAYACAIVSVLSASRTTSNPDGTITTASGSESCSANYEVAFSSDSVQTGPGRLVTCAPACNCDGALINGASGCPSGIKVCPGGTCFNTDLP